MGAQPLVMKGDNRLKSLHLMLKNVLEFAIIFDKWVNMERGGVVYVFYPIIERTVCYYHPSEV